MANIFVRSTTGNDSNDGLSWATAKATLAGAAAIDANGDTIFVSKNHAEVLTANVTLGFAGAWNSAPNRILCVDDTGDPVTPTTLATTATVSGNGLYSINMVNSGYCHLYGISLIGLTGLSLGSSTDQSSMHLIEEATITRVANGGWSFSLGQNGTSRGPARVQLKNVWTSQASNESVWGGGAAWFQWIGGGVLPTSAGTPNGICGIMGGCTYEFVGLDLSRLSTNSTLLRVYNGESGWGYAKYCRMPTGWTGNISDTSNVNSRLEMYGCVSGTSTPILGVTDCGGVSRSTTSIFRANGAKDEKERFSLSCVTASNADRFYRQHRTQDFIIWNDVVGTPITVSVELLTNNVTLTDSDVHMEIVYSGSTSSVYGSILNTKPINLVGSNLHISTANWVAAGYATPIRQKVSGTITPQQRGNIIVRLYVNKPSLTVNICPKLEVSNA
jgi:hypothetical protein